MKYTHAITGSIYAFIVFAVLAFTLNGRGPSDDVEITLTVSTFLFAILAGFFISRLSQRFDKLRQFVATEDAYWLSLYKTCVLMDKTFAEKVRELIDKYYIVWYDLSIGNAYKETAPFIHGVYDLLYEYRALKGDNTESVYDEIVIYLSNLEEQRNRASILNLEKMTKGQWAVLLSLAGIIIFCVYFLKSDALYSQIIAVLLSTVLVLVLLIMRDLQNLMLGGKQCLDESGEEIFDFMGKQRYYHQMWIEKGITVVPEHVSEYRLGKHEPGSTEFDIEVVKR